MQVPILEKAQHCRQVPRSIGIIKLRKDLRLNEIRAKYYEIRSYTVIQIPGSVG